MKNTEILKTIFAIGLIGVIYYYLIDKDEVKSNFNDESNILQQWKQNIDGSNLNKLLNLYSPDAILVTTFGDILTGREQIKPYFEGLFKKEKLEVNYTSDPIIKKSNGLVIFTGEYTFSYIEDGETISVKARYSFITKEINGKVFILKQHSSEKPN